MRKARKLTRMNFFDYLIYLVVILFALLCVIPFVYVVTCSVTPYELYLKNPIRFIPETFDFTAYRRVFSNYLIVSGYQMTLFITITGTTLSLLLLCLSAYPLSKTRLKGRNIVFNFILFTMFFNGGMIPNYYVIRSLNLLNTPFAMILPGVISAYNLIIMINFIKAIPESLEESAHIDGATEWTILFKIIVPLSKPALATMMLFTAVGYWNNFFNAMLYTTKRELWPLALVVREIVIEGQTGLGVDMNDPLQQVTPFTMKMAVIVITTLPIVCVYPFIQKYFNKGIMLGAVKG